MPIPHPTVSRLLMIAAGLFWAYAGVSKAVSLWLPISRNPPEPGAALTWAQSFPQGAIVAVLIIEMIAGFLFLSGRARPALGLACLLLTGFASALLISPPEPGQPCGCMGTTPTPVSPEGSIALIGGLHAVLAACVIPAARASVDSPQHDS